MSVKFTDLPGDIIDEIDPNHNLRHVSNALHRDKLRDQPCMDLRSSREELNRMKTESSNPCGNSTVEYKKGMNLQRPIICAINSKDKTLHVKISDQYFDFFQNSKIVQCFDKHHVLRVTIIPTTPQLDNGRILTFDTSKLEEYIKANNTLRGEISIASPTFQNIESKIKSKTGRNKRSDKSKDNDLYS